MWAAERLRRLLPGLWAGWLLCVALLATPAVFALVSGAQAGRLVGRMLAQEAYTSLVMGVLLLLLERVAARRSAQAGTGPQFSAGMLLALATVFCTVAGYFALQPLLPAAKLGQGAFTFGQLHAASAVFFGLKTVLVLALAWRALTPRPA
ncbi:MAG: DUF4149 domain-containing protein [Leptothrix sp. (in: Bacteria)]|nr:DUF4149 domain-containing protein [Leptothrix sp. (in: b-proteobacteria)]